MLLAIFRTGFVALWVLPEVGFVHMLLTTCEHLMNTIKSFTPKRFVVKEIEQSRNNQIISLTDCKRILNRNGNHYSDEEVLKIRDFLIVLAELQYKHYKSKEDETGDLIYKSLNR